MSTSKETVEALRKALALVPAVSFMPMNGDYHIYSRGRLFAIVSNDELFLKTLPETLCLFSDTTTHVYPGISETCKADPEWLTDPEKLGEAVLYTLAIHPPPPEGRARTASRPAGWLARLPWEKALGCCAALTALYLILPYGMLRAVGVHKGAKADNFAVMGLHGEKMQLSECGGKPVFLYVWETYSQSAIDNLPMINSLYAKYKDKGVCFLPVTVNSDFNATVRALAKAKRFKYPVYNGAGQLEPGKQSPMLYLIDHEGYVRESYSPSKDDQEKISSDLEDLIRDVTRTSGL